MTTTDATIRLKRLEDILNRTTVELNRIERETLALSELPLTNSERSLQADILEAQANMLKRIFLNE